MFDQNRVRRLSVLDIDPVAQSAHPSRISTEGEVSRLRIENSGPHEPLVVAGENDAAATSGSNVVQRDPAAIWCFSPFRWKGTHLTPPGKTFRLVNAFPPVAKDS